VSWLEEAQRKREERRRELAAAVPGSGFAAWFDRSAWSAMAQESPAEFSWPRAVATVIAAVGISAVLFAVGFFDLAVVVGIAIAYAILLWRAHRVHRSYLARAGGGPGDAQP
jgi:hypothetical protein